MDEQGNGSGEAMQRLAMAVSNSLELERSSEEAMLPGVRR